MTVLERIDELRKMRGWSVNYLAMEAMLTQSTLNNLYIRGAEPKISTLRSICDALGVTLTEFFSGMEGEAEEDTTASGEIRKRISGLSDEQKNALLIFLRAFQDK
ncbi:MAG: helix-turn-helix domain-containing protein [Clostridia bacterium]|nr:helix-turn-helix domain-containing protein [Clostridia bacterium]